MSDLNFNDAPTGAKTSERPKEGTQFGVIAQLFNEGKKLDTFKNPPKEYISLFLVVQLNQLSTDPEREGNRLNTRVYFKYNRFEPKPGQKGSPSKMMVILRSLFGSQLEAAVERTGGSLEALLVGLPVMVSIKHGENGKWTTTLSQFPEGIEPLQVENYTPWEARTENTTGGPEASTDDEIPF